MFFCILILLRKASISQVSSNYVVDTLKLTVKDVLSNLQQNNKHEHLEFCRLSSIFE